MRRTDILELKKRLKKDTCTFRRLRGCYVNHDKQIVTKLDEIFLNLEEEEFYKFLEIAKQTLSGKLGEKLLETPVEDEKAMQLLRFMDFDLKNDAAVDAFFDQVIANYESTGNYLILLYNDTYDVISKGTDGNYNESETAYSYLLCAVCPVTLDEPGLSYNETENIIQSRERNWIVKGQPEFGFLYPAFTEREPDKEHALLYKKSQKVMADALVEELFGIEIPQSASEQRAAFSHIVENTCGADSSFELIQSISATLMEQYEEDDSPEINSKEIRRVFEVSGADTDVSDRMRENFESVISKENVKLESIFSKDKTVIKTNDVTITGNASLMRNIKQENRDGITYLMVPVDALHISVNGLSAAME